MIPVPGTVPSASKSVEDSSSALAAIRGPTARRPARLKTGPLRGLASDTRTGATVFAAIRSVGMKCIFRFAYSMEQGSGPQDAAKTQLLKHIAQLKPILQVTK